MGDEDQPRRERRVVELDEWAYDKITDLAAKERRTIKAQVGILLESALRDTKREGRTP